MEFFKRSLGTVLIASLCVFCLPSCGSVEQETSENAFSFFGLKPPFSSSGSSLQPYEYVSYIDQEDNGLHVNKQFEELHFEVTYKPTDYLVVKELKQKEILPADYATVRQDYKDMHYFLLSIKNTSSETDVLKYKISTQAAYSERLKYFAFGMERDLRLVEGTDTIPCSMVLYERNYGISRQANFMIAFPVTDTSAVHDKTILFEDKIFGMGMLKFNVSKESIDAIPPLDVL
ncbi:MAG: hypothetical protein JWM14_2709 [Chitinophagaceae bacterium]|nr:hypothetical protein [Chitinophagaceae bacterium]